MNDQITDPANSADLGPMPDPQVDPGEPNPGGVDAVTGPQDAPAIPDLDTEKNPAVEDAAPDELSEGEDTSTEATREGDDEVPPEEESPA